MSFQTTPHVAVLLASAVVCAVLVVYALWYTYQYEVDRTVVAFGVLLSGMAFYSFARGMQLGFESRELKLLWVRLLYLGFSPGVVGWFVFSVEYSATEPRLGRRSLYALGAYAVTMAATGLTNSWHGLLWSTDPTETVVTGGTLVTLDRSIEPLFVVFIAIAYGLFVVGLFWLLRTALVDKTLFRTQALAIGVGSIVPVVTALPYLFGVSPGGVDFTPASYGIAGILYAYAIFRHRMLHVKPVARDAVISSIRDGFVVLDRRGQIVDYNDSAARFLGTDDLLGKQLATVLPDSATVDSAAGDDGTEWTGQTLAGDLESTGDQSRRPADAGADRNAKQVGVFTTERDRNIEVERSPLVRNGRQTGHLVMLRDITERKQRQQMRQRKNERLEQFASIVSHDLRNPLNVAQLELTRDETGAEYIDNVATSLDRMETIIEDTLTLARQGQTVGEPEEVDVPALAERSWAVVDTEYSSLVIDDVFRIEADPDRLRQVLENLFRNSVEHGTPQPKTATVDTSGGDEVAGSDELRVRIGRIPDGFYVEDNGPGIDPGIRDELFEPGVSSDSDGTGFGLAITSDIVAAHGWEITATEGTTGGARFEITGVSFVADE